MDRLARLIARRRRPVLAFTVVFVLFAAAFGGPVVSLLDSDDDFEDHGSESILARDAVERATGRQLAFTQVGEQVEQDLARAELLAFPLLFLLSLVVFRSVVAALLPVAVGGTTILATFVWLRLVNEIEPMSVFAINLITGAGLGLAIDYSLFVVSRFREELATGADTGEALGRT